MNGSSNLIHVESTASNQASQPESFTINMFTDNNTSLFQTSSNSYQPGITFFVVFNV